MNWLLADGVQHFREAGRAGTSVFLDHVVNNHCLTKREAETADIIQTVKMRAEKYCMPSLRYTVYAHAVVSVAAHLNASSFSVFTE